MSRLIPLAAGAALLGAALPAWSDTVPGSIPGNSSVNANGAALYSMPITLPKGAGGLQPDLSLVYDSQGGLGLAGYRWELSGLSTITRCINTYAEDGQASPVADNASDDFCLDGQKLRPDSNGNYRTEIDGFSEVIPHTSGGPAPVPLNGPQWFEVKTKDGLTYIYGGTGDSQQWLYFPGPTNSRANSCGTVRWNVVNAWTLSQIRDRNGNAIDFSYAQDICTGAYWPTSITYTDRVSTSGTGSVNSTGPETVSFSYDDLTKAWPPIADTSESFSGGNGVGHTHRLNGITVSYNGATTYSYALNYQYDPATNYSELASVQECASGHCLPATSVNWDAGGGQGGWGTTHVTNDASSAAGSSGTPYAMTMDAFGDGTEQLVYPVYPGGTWYVGHITPSGVNIEPFDSGQTQVAADGGSTYVAMPIRYLGNGRESILQAQYHPGAQATYWHVITVTPETFPNTQTTNIDTGVLTNSTDWTNTIVADVNGDGLDDIVVARTNPSDGNAALYVYLNSPTGFSTTAKLLYDSGKAAGNNPPWLDTSVGGARSGVRQADFDGDGRADLVLKWGNGVNSPPLWWVMQSTGTKSDPQMTQYAAITDADPSHDLLLLDANGDGLTDILYVCAQGATTCTPGHWVLSMSTGWGMDETDTGKIAAYPDSAIITDYNGDGHQDVMFPTSGDWYVFHSEYYPVTSSNPVAYYGLSAGSDTGIPTSAYPNPMTSNTPVIAMDLGGDGLLDLVGVDPSSGKYEFAMHEAVPLRATSVTDGLGNQVQWNYASITSNSSVYSAASGNVSYPTSPAPMPLAVVSSYQMSSGANNGDAANYTVSYTYQGVASDVLGRGFLGFASVQQVDSRLGTTTVTTYDQAFPYIGKMTEQTATTSGTLQVDLQNTYADIVTAGNAAAYTDANFPYISKSIVYSYGSGGHDAMSGQLVKTVKTTTTFDDFGNPTLITTDTNPGASGHFEQNLIYTYSEDVADWCMSLPETMTIAKSYGYANTTPGTDNGRYGNQARETTYNNDYVNCRVNSKTAIALEPGLSLTTTDTYGDAWGNVTETQVTDGNNNVLRDTAYDFSGTNGISPTTVTENDSTNGINLQTAQTWDLARGVMLSSEDVKDSLTTSFTYDSFGRTASETQPDQTSVRYVYTGCPGGGCASGAAYRMDATHYASDGVTASDTLRTNYDSYNRAIETMRYVLNDQKVYQDTQYNSLGLKVGVTAPYLAGATQYWTTTAYDNLNRPKIITQPADQNDPTGKTISVEYDSDYSGAVAPYAVTTTVTTSAADGVPTQVKSKVLDSQGVTVEVQDAENDVVYDTDAFGEPITITDTSKATSASNVTHINYDSVGHKINMTDPDTGKWTYQVDALGEVTGETDANGDNITQLYDELGRLVARNDTDNLGNTTKSSWTYDTATGGAGKLASETKGDFTKSYSYDSYGRASSTDTNIAGTDYLSSETYDKFGRVASVTYPATPAAPADTAPTSNAGVAQTVVAGNSVTLDGSASTEASGAPMPLTYTWSETGGPVNVGIDGSRTPTVSFTPVAAGVYTFQLMVGDGELTNTSSVTVTVNLQVPPAPTVAAANFNGNVALKWTDVSGVTYTVFQSSDGTTWTQVPGSVTGGSDTVTGLADGTYYFALQAAQNGFTSIQGPSSGSTTVLLPPSGVSLSPANSNSGTFTLSWAAGSTATYYQVYESSVGGGAPWTSTNVNTTSYKATNLANGSYTFYVLACDTSGCTPSSTAQVVNGTVNITAPVSLSLSPSTSRSGSFTLSWSSSWSGPYPFQQYRIFQSFNGGSWTWAYTTNNTSQVFTNLAPGSYTYHIEACNQGSAGWADCSGASSQVTDTVSLLWPNSLSFNPAGTSTNGSFTLSWNSTWNGPYNFEQYRIYQSSNGGASWTWVYTINNTTSQAFSGLSNGTYIYKIQACNLNACSDYSATASESVSTGGGNTGGGGTGGCPPPPKVCQLVFSDDDTAYAPGVSESTADRFAVTLPSVVEPSGQGLLSLTTTETGTGPQLAMLTSPSMPPAGHAASMRPVPATVARRLALLRKDLRRTTPSLISPAQQPAWQQRWAAVHRVTGADAGTRFTAAGIVSGTAPRDAAEALEQARQDAVYTAPDTAEQDLQDRLNTGDAADGYGVEVADATSATSFTVDYVYDDHDNLEAVVDDQDPTLVYWQAQSADNWGNTTGAIYGNNVLTTRVYDSASGNLLGVTSGLGIGTAIQNEQYQWDGLGNLSQRQDLNAGLTESFQYDELNRLSKATVSGGTVSVPVLSMSYDAFGNISSKSDVGAYAYDPAHAHRLQSVTPAAGTQVTYQFDNNGNLLSSTDGHSTTWTVDNKPASITNGGNTTTFAYDPENVRYREYSQVGGANGTTTLEIGGLMEVVTPDGGTPTYRLMIKAGSETVAVRTVQASGSFTVNYLHHDHLGSVDAITDESGNVVQRLSYDSFGRRRDPATWALLAPGGNYTSVTDRGYTGQQELDSIGLIHMNGRVYDPVLGRFMSADPNIQDVYYSQSLNRYAYVDNNPLRYVDPSGYCTAASDAAGILSGGLFGGSCGRNAMKTLVVDAWHFINHPAKVLEYTAPGVGNFINVRMSHSQTMQRLGGDVALVVSVVFSCTGIGAPIGAAVYAGYEAYIADLNGASGLEIAEVGAISYASAYSTDSGAQSFVAGFSKAILKDEAGQFLENKAAEVVAYVVVKDAVKMALVNSNVVQNGTNADRLIDNIMTAVGVIGALTSDSISERRTERNFMNVMNYSYTSLGFWEPYPGFTY